ncbi:nucleotidyltransferase substrate binding protein [Radiobacillus kanasensis]|uniref:HI0074 family nucleotidyltransferase substrate-binding subunit n=1 Tax=Radiobacillus kanasensis TaxID=2844358 RepID=UPI001E347A67|nr:HI0074 family nucleotidyltransferase substrate-binding subunit [Radiobacillus kanasensis]UFU00203.1 nucleotidyltransferase substrate binding protein [Radiobacillus kanasensis]
MERLQQRINSAEKALSSFAELVDLKEPSSVERDALIKRFKFSFEACWKAAKQYLYDIEGIDVASPKGVMRSLRENSILNEDEAIKGIGMVDDRNLTVHAYNKEVAVKIQANLKEYYQLLVSIIERMKSRA